MNSVIIKLFYFAVILGNYAALQCYTDFIKSETLTFSFYFSDLITYVHDIKASLLFFLLIKTEHYFLV